MRFNLAMLALVGLFTLSACGKNATTFNHDMGNYYGAYGQDKGLASATGWFVAAPIEDGTQKFTDDSCGYVASMGPYSDAGLSALVVTQSNHGTGCLVEGTYNCTVTKSMGAHDLKALTIACDGQTTITLDQSLIYHY